MIDVPGACRELANGEVVAVPTESVYGLSCDAMNTDAIQKSPGIERP